MVWMKPHSYASCSSMHSQFVLSTNWKGDPWGCG